MNARWRIFNRVERVTGGFPAVVKGWVASTTDGDDGGYVKCRMLGGCRALD
jgi:hypothetical protein